MVVACDEFFSDDDVVDEGSSAESIPLTPEEIENILNDPRIGKKKNNPVNLPIDIDFSTDPDDFEDLLERITETKTYVKLDLSNCPVPETGEFDPGIFKLNNNNGYITSLVLPKKATAIEGDMAGFKGLYNLESVRGENVETIGDYAFSGCTSLKTVDLPKAIEIGNGAFNGCTSLETVDFPEAIEIGNSAFKGCTSLETVNLPEAIEIGLYAFSGCTSLKTVDLPEATEIWQYAFAECTSLTKLNIPSVIFIREGAFSYTGETTPLTITFGDDPPAVEPYVTLFTESGKSITVRIPKTAEAKYNETWVSTFVESSSINKIKIKTY
jgi:hypothetical protein